MLLAKKFINVTLLKPIYNATNCSKREVPLTQITNIGNIMEKSLENAYLETVNDGNMPIIVVTTGTQDFQDSFIARLHIMDMSTNTSSPTETFEKAKTLAEIRKQIPFQCGVVARSPNDDPVIVESWL